MDIKGFDWGTSNDWYQETISKEVFEDKIYEKFFEVQEGDIVVDFGASNGPFPYSIKHKNPLHVYCFEPSFEQLTSLKNNLSGINHTIIPKGISNIDGFDKYEVYGSVNHFEKVECIKFNTFLKNFNIDKIDFLKTDCEGGEYSIFNFENLCWLKDNLGVAVGEWHLSTPEQKQQFRVFRDVFLRLFPNHNVYSVNGVDIKWDLWNEHFIEYYNEVIIYINNK